MSTISASSARQTLPAQLDRVESGEEVEITRHGRVVAVLVHPEALKSRRAPEALSEADRIGALLDDARKLPVRTAALTPEQAEELIDDVRAHRSARSA